MLVVYNLTSLATDILYIDMKQVSGDQETWLYCGYNPESCPIREIETSTLLFCFGILLFNVSHFMFAHKYYEISKTMPFKIENKEVPRKTIICNKVLYWIFLILNLIFPILTAVGFVGFEDLAYKYLTQNKENYRLMVIYAAMSST